MKLSRKSGRAIYEQALENAPAAPAEMRRKGIKLKKVFEQYLTDVQEESFIYGYQVGFEAGRKTGQEENGRYEDRNKENTGVC